MADQTDFLQRLAGEAVSFFECDRRRDRRPAGQGRAHQGPRRQPGQRAAMLPPCRATSSTAIKAYRDASDPTPSSGAQALADIAVVLDAIAADIETWLRLGRRRRAGARLTPCSTCSPPTTSGCASRRLFLFLQRCRARGRHLDVRRGQQQRGRASAPRSSRCGASSSSRASRWSSSTASSSDDNVARVHRLPAYAWPPRSWASSTASRRVEPDPRRPHRLGRARPRHRLAAGARAGRRHLRADDFVLVRVGQGRLSTDPSAAGKLMVSTAMVPKDEGGTAVFLALGGEHRHRGARSATSGPSRRRYAATPVSPRCSARSSDWPDRQRRQLRGERRVRVARPTRPPTCRSRFPSAKRHPPRDRHARPSRSPSPPAGAEMLVTLDDSAVVVDSTDNDGFVSELLGHTPLRLPFGIVVGYSSSRGLVLEGTALARRRRRRSDSPLSVVRATSAHRSSPRPSRSAAASARSPCTRSPCASPAGRPTSRRRQMNQPTLEADTSFSAQIGPVYFRLDQLGLMVTLDESKPPEERNLRFVDLHAGVKFPRGIAVHVDTRCVAGGGSILHDPDQGHLLRHPRPAPSAAVSRCKAIGLIATKNPDGTKGFSLIVIVTVELATGYPLGMGFFLAGLRRDVRAEPDLRRDRDARGAADRAAAQRAVPRRPGAPHDRDAARAADALPGPAGQPPVRPARQDRLGPSDPRAVRARRDLPVGPSSTG